MYNVCIYVTKIIGILYYYFYLCALRTKYNEYISQFIRDLQTKLLYSIFGNVYNQIPYHKYTYSIDHKLPKTEAR